MSSSPSSTSTPSSPRRRRPRGRPPHPDVLTPAEWRILNWIRHGLSRRRIAEHVRVSENAVKYHIANIGSKLGVTGLAELRHWPGYPVDSPLNRSVPMSSPSTQPTGAAQPATPASTLGPIGQVSLLARDIARAERFYRDTLGLPHIFTFGQLAFFDLAGVRLYVHAVPDADWHAGSILYFRVGDIDAIFEALSLAGVSFVGRPHLVHRHDDTGIEEWMAFFEDPDGNQLALMAQVSAR